MTPVEVHDFLRQIGSHWTGQGTAMELGSWLGASAVPLLEGLAAAGYDRQFWAFDKWITNEEQVKKASLQGQELKNKQDILPLFIRNTASAYSAVTAVRGAIPETLKRYSGDPIEICIFDAPKRNPVFIKSMQALEPYFIPGVTILGLLDYYFYKRNKGEREALFQVQEEFIQAHPESFTKIMEWPGLCSCAFFKYKNPVKWKQK